MSTWFYAKNGKQFGPFSLSQLQQLAKVDLLLPKDLVWEEGTPQWVAAHTVPGLIPVLAVERVADPSPVQAPMAVLVTTTTARAADGAQGAPVALLPATVPTSPVRSVQPGVDSTAPHQSPRRASALDIAVAAGVLVALLLWQCGGSGGLFHFIPGLVFLAYACRVTITGASIDLTGRLHKSIGYRIAGCAVGLLGLILICSGLSGLLAKSPAEETVRSAQPTVPVAVRMEVYPHLLRSTVLIVTDTDGLGTGWIVDKDRRLVITNYHVIDDSSQVVVIFPFYRGGHLVTEQDYYLKNVQNLQRAQAQIVDADPARDLA